MPLHTIPPVCDAHSHTLVLGSFPSVKSRESGFFYGHPQNRFWRVLATVFQEHIAETTEEKTALLLRHGIALWDVIASCDIAGSSDSSIENVVPNDIGTLLRTHPSITRVFTNGGTAHALYLKHCMTNTNIADVPLPSTSPANAAFSLERLVAVWQQVAPAD